LRGAGWLGHGCFRLLAFEQGLNHVIHVVPPGC
jgi:hypothetical protein